ncbi:pyridoxal phosphate-dependent transferase [Pelagophyceae sp. CCMP2097]|nr:pyridoxal phosphate-dependent transferase [Pelagophyceae sp. CCMP2097]
MLDALRPYYESTDVGEALPTGLPPRGKSPRKSARHVQAILEDAHALDSNEKLNTSSYVTVVLEPEEEAVALMGLRVNLADQTVYPQSFDIHNRCVDTLAKLWHCPPEADGKHVGAGTVGSTEACLLAGLALKFRWRVWYAARHDAARALGEFPNLACWEKLFRYMDVEPRFVKPTFSGSHAGGRGWRLDPAHVAAAIDDHTMGVVCIVGNHYSGHYDRVDEIDAVVSQVNAARGFQVGIHVDAASGGFVAPFQDVPAWDFRCPNVLSVSASGHKFGQACCGTGWIVWRERRNLAEHVAISVGYLGGKADSYTLNFSRPAAGVYVQYYKFLRLGADGYARIVRNQLGGRAAEMAVARFIRCKLAAMARPGGEKYFEFLDAGDAGCLPVVAARLDPALGLPFDDIDLQHAISRKHWYVSGYKLDFVHPTTGEVGSLFSDLADEEEGEQTTMIRIVVKANLSMAMASDLVAAIDESLKYLEAHGAGFFKHPAHVVHVHKAAC